MANIKCMFSGHKLELEEIYREHILCKVCGQRWNGVSGEKMVLINAMYVTVQSDKLPGKDLVEFWHEYNLDELVAQGDVEGLKLKLKNGDIFVSRRASTALGRMHNSQAVDVLLEFLEDEKQDQVSIAQSLGQVGDEKIIKPLLSTFASTKNVMLQDTIAKSLLQFDDQRVIDMLIRRLTTNLLVNEAEIEALLRMNGDLSSATTPLIKKFRDYYENNQFVTGNFVVNVLIRLHDANSIEPLTDIFKNGKKESIREAAAKILKSLEVSITP